ncbi:MAG TPA: hypothetical protein VMT76_12780 [Puia sp.]|nr:hypothetical protein [Puia sp.]
MKIALIIGGTRPNQIAEAVPKRAYDKGFNRTDAEFTVVGLRDYTLPVLDEPMSASMGRYA